MFKFFRKKRAQDGKPNPAAEKAASVLATAFLKAQTAWAGWLSDKEKKMTLRQKKMALVVIGICMVMLPASILYNGIYKGHKQFPSWLQTPSVTLPEDTRLPDSLNIDYLRELYKQKHAEQAQKDSSHD